MRSLSISLFTFLTAVSLSMNALGEERTSCKPDDLTKFKKEAEELCAPKTGVELANCVRETSISLCTGTAMAATTSQCDEAKKAFTAANSDMKGGSPEDAIMCIDCSGKKTPAPSYCKGRENQTEEDRARLKERLKGAPKSKAADIIAISSCPPLSSKLSEKYEERIEDHKKNVDTLTDEINTIKEEKDAAEAEMKQAQDTFTTSIEELNTKLEEDTRKFKENESAKTKEKRGRYDELNSQISQMISAIQVENTKKIEAISAQERTCHNKALDQLNGFLAKRNDSLSKSQLSSGSLRNLLGSSGKTRAQKNADYANKYYKSCLRDKNYLDAINSIKRQHGLALDQINQSILSARSQQMTLIKEISGEETVRKFQEQIQAIYNDHNRNKNKLEKEYQATIQAASKKLENAQRKLEQKLADQKLAQTELANDRQIFQIANDAEAGETDYTKSELVGSFMKLRSAADNVQSSCKCSDSATTEKTACDSSMNIICYAAESGSGECTNPGSPGANFKRSKAK